MAAPSYNRQTCRARSLRSARVAMIVFALAVAMAGMARAWRAPLHGGSASPAVADGRVIVGTRDGKVEAFDAASGAPLWSFQTGSGLPPGGFTVFYGATGTPGQQMSSALSRVRAGRAEITSAPIVVGGSVIAVGEDQWLYSLDATSGTLLWSLELGGALVPFVDDSLVYVSAGSARFHAVEIESGRERWRLPVNLVSCISSGEGRLYVASGSDASGYFHAYDPDEGRELWRIAAPGEPLAPLFAAGRVYAAVTPEFDEGTVHTTLSALNPSTGSVLWSYEAPGKKHWGIGLRVPPVEIAGDAVVLTTSRGVHVLDAATGALRWRHDLAGTQDRALVEGGTLIVTAADIHAFNLATGEERWAHPIAESGDNSWAWLGSSWRHLLDHGTLFIVTKKFGNAITAIDLATGKDRWVCRIGNEVLARPTLAGGRLYVSTAAKWTVGKPPPPAALLAIDVAAGKY